MHNMYEQFYKFISELIISFFRKADFKPGAKYDIRLPNQNEVIRLYEQLSKCKEAEDFRYQYEGRTPFETKNLDIKGKKIIIAIKTESITDAFLTGLRNKVGTDEELFRDKAILFIHDSSLDSILKGSDSLQKVGMPLHTKEIEYVIEERLKLGNYDKSVKQVLQFVLDGKKKLQMDVRNAIIEYRDILEVLSTGKIGSNEYNEFGLFFDSGLNCGDEKDVRERLQANAKYYNLAFNVHHFNAKDSLLDKDFDKRGLSLISSTYWNTVDFAELKKSIDRKANSEPIIYFPNEQKLTEEGVSYWEHIDQNTAKGKRTFNIVVFNEEKKGELILKLRFSQNPKQTSCQVDKGSEMSVEVKGKYVYLRLQGHSDQISFSKLKYKDVKDYEYRILVIPTAEKYFTDFKTNYRLSNKIKEKGFLIEQAEGNFKLNPSATEEQSIYRITDFEQNIELMNENSLHVIQEIDNPEGDLIRLNVFINQVQIPIYIKGEAIKPKLITCSKLFKIKREEKIDFTYDYNEEEQSFKLFQDTNQYYAVDELLECLRYERRLVVEGMHYYYQENRYHLVGSRLELNEGLHNAYENLIQYYREHRTLPSLARTTEELRELMQAYVGCYVRTVNEIVDGSILTEQQKALNHLGVIYNPIKGEILWSPLHPLNIAYELQKEINLKDENIDEQVLKKIKPLGLVTYIKDDDGQLYKGKEFSQLMWLKFINTKLRGNEDKSQIAKIVEKNMVNFLGHYRYLFEASSELPLRINLFNIGEGYELLGGLFRYINGALKNHSPEEITPVEVRIYSEDQRKSIFHEVSYDTVNLEELSERFEIDYVSNELTLGEYISIFRRKVSIYRVEQTNGIMHSHLSFIGMNHMEQVNYRNIDDIEANIYLEGMISSPTVYKELSNYVKASGLKGMPNNEFTQLIRAVNAMAYVGMSNTPFDHCGVTATIVGEEDIKRALSFNEASMWTIYLEPKVDFNYFTDNQMTTIHYVDRLYSPNSLDALTVSKNIQLYQSAVENKIEALGLEKNSDNIASMIIFGNIINGEWLLNLVSARRTNVIESMHNAPIISWASHLLDNNALLWVPVSLYEFMKTCDDIGLKSNKGLLKKKSYEGLINDIIWIGFDLSKDQIEVAFYPMSLRKSDQDQGVYKELKENVYEYSFTGKYIRQVLIQRALFNLDQLVKKGLFEHDLCDKLQSPAEKDKLLRDEYELTNSYQQQLGQELIVTFTEEPVIKAVPDGQHYVGYVNKKLLWMNEFDLQSINQTLEANTFEVQQISSDAEQKKVQEDTAELEKPEREKIDIERIDENKSRQIDSQEDLDAHLEVILPAAVYSILCYYDQVPEQINEYIRFYLKRGIKPYIIFKDDESTVKEKMGADYEFFMTNIKNQMMSLTFNADIEIEEEEATICDGQSINESFWNQIKKTAFNSEQYDIEHQPLTTNLSVRAGAGTGKTKVMIDRIMFLKHLNPAMSLSEVAMITFTNESTMEMRTRLSKRLTAYYHNTQDIKYLRWMDELSNMHISTIHAFSLDLLRQIGDEIGIVNLQISSFKHEKSRMIEDGIEAYSKAFPEEYRNFSAIKQYKLKKLINEVMNFLDNRAILLSETEVRINFGDSKNYYHHLFEFVVHYVSERLEKLKEERGKYEINDLIKMLRSLSKVERINNKIRFSYIMVDEFQDTDEVQVAFIAWLVEQLQSSLFVVGDVKQSIYRFRGADYTAFEQLEKASTTTLTRKNITKNYRTDEKLMKRLNKLFATLGDDVEKFEFDETSSLTAMKSDESVEGYQRIWIDDHDSPFAVTRDIYKQQIQKGTVCVLCRTNSEVNEIVQNMEDMNIPCIAEVKGNFYRHLAVRDFYLLVRCMLHEERMDEWVLLQQSVYGEGKLPPEYIAAQYTPDKNYIRPILDGMPWYIEMINLAKKAQSVPAIKVLREIIEKRKPQITYAQRYYKHLMKDQTSRAEEVKKVALHKGLEYEANLNHLLYLLQREFSDQTMTLYRLAEYLKRKITSDNVEDMITLEVDEKLHALRVMTVHKAKGLEFNTVILPYTNKKFISYRRNQYMLSKNESGYDFGYSIYSNEQQEGCMTSTNSCYTRQSEEENKELVGDETRLFYVACTRAESALYLLVDKFTQKSSRINSWKDLVIRGE